MVICAGIFVKACSPDGTVDPYRANTTAAPVAIISAEQLAARNNEAAKEDAAAGCAVQVQKLMKNPKAFDGDLADARVTSTETDGVVFLTYRSTNSYNAVTQGSALCKFTRNGTNTSITEVQIVKK